MTDAQYEAKTLKEKKERRERIEHAKLVLLNLGFYEREKNDADWYISGKDNKGRGLHIGIGHHDKNPRFTISGTYPRNGKGEYVRPCGYSEKSPEINVSASRSVTAISKDIERRLLPDYEGALAYCQKQIKLDDNFEQETNDNFALVLRRKPNDEENRSKRGEIVFPGEGWGHVQVSSDSATIELRSIPVELAARIVDILQGAA